MNQSPPRSIWFNPSQTVAHIAHENPGYRLFILPVAAGFAAWPTQVLFSVEEKAVENGLVLLTLLSFGPFLEILQLFIGAYFLRATGAWLGGTASIVSIQSAIAWGNVPIVALAILSILLMPVAPVYFELTESELLMGQSALITGIGFFLLALQIVLVSWSVAIFIKGLAIVQGFTIGRAILNSLAAWMLAGGIIVIVTLVLGHSDKILWLFFTGIDDVVMLRGQ